MTDTEIIKALECCAYGHKCCDVCPYDDNGFFCSDKMKKDAIDLINRQKTEIDILIRKKETLKDEIAELQAENERWKRLFNSLNDEMVYAKIDATKYYLERLKSELEIAFDEPIFDTTIGKIIESSIDKLLRELESENNV